MHSIVWKQLADSFSPCIASTKWARPKELASELRSSSLSWQTIRTISKSFASTKEKQRFDTTAASLFAGIKGLISSIGGKTNLFVKGGERSGGDSCTEGPTAMVLEDQKMFVQGNCAKELRRKAFEMF
jgi:hypothetical protein